MSIAAGVHRRTRINCFARPSPSMAQKRRLPDGWPPRRRLHTCREKRSTSDRLMPRRGCLNMAPSMGCARSTATNPGTTNCAPKPSITAAHLCMPTPPRIQGCISNLRALAQPMLQPCRRNRPRFGITRSRIWVATFQEPRLNQRGARFTGPANFPRTFFDLKTNRSWATATCRFSSFKTTT